MPRSGEVHIIYKNEQDDQKRVVVPFRFRNFIWLVKILLTAYKTRCHLIKIVFDKKLPNGKPDSQHRN
jgi:hypothetical protein